MLMFLVHFLGICVEAKHYHYYHYHYYYYDYIILIWTKLAHIRQPAPQLPLSKMNFKMHTLEVQGKLTDTCTSQKNSNRNHRHRNVIF